MAPHDNATLLPIQLRKAVFWGFHMKQFWYLVQRHQKGPMAQNSAQDLAEKNEEAHTSWSLGTPILALLHTMHKLESLRNNCYNGLSKLSGVLDIRPSRHAQLKWTAEGGHKRLDRRTVGQTPPKCPETSNSMWLSWIWVLMIPIEL